MENESSFNEEILKKIDSNVEKLSSKKIKKNIEFSKKWLVGCVSITILFTLASYILSAFDKNPVESLSIQIIQSMCAVDGISFLGYNIQNSIRAYSLNKYVNQDNSKFNINRERG